MLVAKLHRFWLVVCAMTFVFAAPTSAETFTSREVICHNDDHDNHALLVGVHEYLHVDEWGELPLVLNEVRELSSALSDHFDVDVLKSPELETLKARVDQFFKCADEDDRLLFYHAGHGFSPPRARGFSSRRTEAYLVARDTLPLHSAGHSTALSVSWLLDRARTSKARDVLVVLDACQVATVISGVDLKQSQLGFNHENCDNAVLANRELENASLPLRRAAEAAFTATALGSRNVITSGYAANAVPEESGFANAFRAGLSSADGFSAFGGPLVRDNQVDTKELVRFVQNRLAELKYQQKPQLACATPKLFLL